MFNKNIYTYCSAKKIYFAKTAAKCMLIEKKDYHSNGVISLISHNPIIVSKKGIILFPKLK